MFVTRRRLRKQVNELKAELCGMEDEIAQANRRIEELEAELVFRATSAEQCCEGTCDKCGECKI